MHPLIGTMVREYIARDPRTGLPIATGRRQTRKTNKKERVLHIGDRIAVSVIGLDKFNPALITFGHEISYFPEHPHVIIVGASPIGTKMAEDWLKHGARP